MLRNFLVIAYRTMLRQLSYSLINVVGLAIGIACSLVIFLFVYGEWSYDRGFANSERIYKVGISFFNIGNFANGPERLLEILPSQFEGVEAATRVKREASVAIMAGTETIIEPTVYYADSSFFRVFSHTFVAGDPRVALYRPNEAVITESTARKYFNTIDVVGKTILVGKEKTPFNVVGVTEDVSFNATVKSKVYLSNNALIEGSKVWSSASFYNYILLKERVTEADLLGALNTIFEKNVYPESGMPMGFKSFEDYNKSENAVRFHTHALRDVYLKSKLNFELTPGGNESNIYIFSGVAVFILVLAAVNFINLTTARASRRAREVGIRKALGTSRGRLIAQFLMESIAVSTAAMLLAVVLSEVFLLAFTYVTGTPLLSTIWKNPATVALFLGFSVLVGFASGIYPAFYLTSFQPVKVLKGNLTASGGGRFRNVLVIFQFSVSIVLLVCATVVQRQLHFVQTKELGFDQQNILTIDRADLLKESGKTYKDELAAYTGVQESSVHMGEPGSRRWLSFYTYQTKEMQSALTINTYSGDADFMKILGMRLINGRAFNKDLASDKQAIILNEAAVNALNLGDNPIGTIINEKDQVIGVVSDFHWESLRNSIAPLAIRFDENMAELSFKLEPGHVADFLAVAEARWKELAPGEPFSYHFVDDNFADLLKKEAVLGKAINFFTLLAIFVSCMGLYGLSAYTAEQRTKEIGIRKVMGASAQQIVLMLNRKFTILVMVSIVVSVPVALYIAQKWLEGFAYKVELGAGVFLFSIGIALVMAWATVSFHSIKASWINPSDTLKYE